MTLTTNQESQIALAVRHPRYLLQIDIDSQTLRYASGGTVTWDGETWARTGIIVKSLKNGKGGMEGMRLEVQDEADIMTQIAISNSFAFARVRLWEYYGTTTSVATDDPIKKFDGEVVGVPFMAQTVVFDCATKGAVTKRIPNLTLTAPDVNHMPYSGQSFVIGNERYTIEIN